jgi:hypothetical protein
MERVRKPPPPGARQPRCIKCGALMILSRVNSRETEGVRYGLHTFECPACQHSQTYTMGYEDPRD